MWPKARKNRTIQEHYEDYSGFSSGRVHCGRLGQREGTVMLRNAAIVYFTFATALHAQTVYENTHIRASWWAGVPPQYPPQINFEIWKNDQFPPEFPPLMSPCVDCGGEISFEYDGARIKASVLTADEGSDWFLVQPGDAFSRATINAGQFPTIINLIPPPAGGEVTVGSGEFYLGVSTGSWMTSPDERPRTAYGWVHLRPVNGVLTMVSNVMSYNSPGIIVGTTTLVPEPATCVLVTAAGLVCLCRRRRPVPGH
jgi:hypothetical protein